MDGEEWPDDHVWCDSCQGLGFWDQDPLDPYDDVDEFGTCLRCHGRGHHKG